MTRYLELFAGFVTSWVGTSWAFLAAFGAVLLWGLTGWYFDYSDTWQLVINTGTTITTFLMVFLLQRSQNKESKVLHLKLNEIIAALDGASNRLITVELLSEKEVLRLYKKYQRLADKVRSENRWTSSHSVEEEDDE